MLDCLEGESNKAKKRMQLTVRVDKWRILLRPRLCQLARDLAFACTIMLCKVIQSMKERTKKRKKERKNYS